MKISGKTWGVPGAESSYRQFTQKVKAHDEAQSDNKSQKITNHGSEKQKTEINNILTTKEVEALKALFGNPQEPNQSLYGVSKIKNVRTGLLLDLKG